MPKNTSKNTVTIKNGETESQVAPSAVKHFEEVGWTVVDDGNSETQSQEQAQSAQQPVEQAPVAEGAAPVDQPPLNTEDPERKDQ